MVVLDLQHVIIIHLLHVMMVVYIFFGCTNPIACNYDPLATCDDGSCFITDPSACNYNAVATCDDGSCNTVYGCTNSAACNYDSSATCDDGTCILPDGCTDPIACNYDPAAVCDDGSCSNNLWLYESYSM